jgi:hypothetical protein
VAAATPAKRTFKNGRREIGSTLNDAGLAAILCAVAQEVNGKRRARFHFCQRFHEKNVVVLSQRDALRRSRGIAANDVSVIESFGCTNNLSCEISVMPA